MLSTNVFINQKRRRNVMKVPAYNSGQPIINFSQLPLEIKICVFAFLPPKDIVCNVRLTCHSFKELSESQILWAEAARRTFEIAPAEKEKAVLRIDATGEQQSINVLCKAASEGCRRAQKELLDVLENLEPTLDSCALFKNLSYQRNPWAKYCLASIYLKLGSDYSDKAKDLLEEAKNKGLLIAQFLLAGHLKKQGGKSYGDKTAYSAGVEMLEDLANKNYYKALLYKANKLPDGERKKNLLQRAFEDNDQDAEVLYHFGMLIEGEGRINFLKKSMALGFIQAGIDLAPLLDAPYEIKDPCNSAELACKINQMHLKSYEDWNTPVNPELENCAYHFGKKEGFVLLPYFYTLIFLSEDVLEKNEEIAFFWFKKVIASRIEGNLYDFIDYQSLDSKIEEHPTLFRRIVAFYTYKANSGKAYYQFRLAELYEQGKFGVKKDITKALELYEQAAEKNDFDAVTALYFFNVKHKLLSGEKFGLLCDKLKKVPEESLNLLYAKLTNNLETEGSFSSIVYSILLSKT